MRSDCVREDLSDADERQSDELCEIAERLNKNKPEASEKIGEIREMQKLLKKKR